MPASYRSYNPEQTLLVAPCIRDWWPTGHFAHRISSLTDQFDLSEFHKPCKGDGRRNMPYHPMMMLKVLIYAYSVGVFSSRAIESRIQADIACRFLAAESCTPK